MLRNGAYPICDGENVTVRVRPALTTEANMLREALEILEAGIVHVSGHGPAGGDDSTCPTSDHGA